MQGGFGLDAQRRFGRQHGGGRGGRTHGVQTADLDDPGPGALQLFSDDDRGGGFGDGGFRGRSEGFGGFRGRVDFGRCRDFGGRFGHGVGQVAGDRFRQRRGFAIQRVQVGQVGSGCVVFRVGISLGRRVVEENLRGQVDDRNFRLSGNLVILVDQPGQGFTQGVRDISGSFDRRGGGFDNRGCHKGRRDGRGFGNRGRNHGGDDLGVLILGIGLQIGKPGGDRGRGELVLRGTQP